MDIRISDWTFQVDVEATFTNTSENSLNHCECAYCRNYYECVDLVYPELKRFLSQFGVVLEGPSELMPFTPTLMLACYRVYGRVVHRGIAPIYVSSVPVTIEEGDKESFLLWIGEFVLPWIQDETEEDVISPANTQEFMERMQQVWNLRHTEESILS